MKILRYLTSSHRFNTEEKLINHLVDREGGIKENLLKKVIP